MRVVVAVLLLLGTARAAPPDPTEQARAYYEEATRHFELGEYDAAVANYKYSYLLSKQPELLFNIAQAYRLSKNWDMATRFYQSYLREQPEAPNRRDVDKWLREIERARTAEARAAREAVTLAPRPAGAGDDEDPTAAPDRAEGRRGGGLVLAGIFTAGAGLIGVGIGTFYGLRASQDWDDLNRDAALGVPWDAHRQGLYDQARSDETKAKIFWIGGGIVAAGGVALAIVGWRESVTPAVAAAPGGATFGVAGRF